MLAKKSKIVNTKYNISTWIENNNSSFLPPVCNKLMYGHGQLKIMFVGGPNQRKDYHIEQGEELFYQVKGDMVVKIMEKGQPRDVLLKEGQIFVLPGRIPHSPQRYENTVGLVIERERSEHEIDGLRYYQPSDPTKSLWERWFHCHDLGVQLKPVIEEFFASEAHKTGVPQDGDVAPEPKLKIDTEKSAGDPFYLAKWLEEHAAEIKTGTAVLYSGGEFTVEATGVITSRSVEEHQLFVWQFRGSTTMGIDSDAIHNFSLSSGDVILLEPGQKLLLDPRGDSVTLLITMTPTVV